MIITVGLMHKTWELGEMTSEERIARPRARRFESVSFKHFNHGFPHRAVLRASKKKKKN